MKLRLYLARLLCGKEYEVRPIDVVSIPSVWIPPFETWTVTTTITPNTTTLWITS